MTTNTDPGKMSHQSRDGYYASGQSHQPLLCNDTGHPVSLVSQSGMIASCWDESVLTESFHGNSSPGHKETDILRSSASHREVGGHGNGNTWPYSDTQ